MYLFVKRRLTDWLTDRLDVPNKQTIRLTNELLKSHRQPSLRFSPLRFPLKVPSVHRPYHSIIIIVIINLSTQPSSRISHFAWYGTRERYYNLVSGRRFGRFQVLTLLAPQPISFQFLFSFYFILFCFFFNFFSEFYTRKGIQTP